MPRYIDAEALMLTLIGLRLEAMRRADFSDAAKISQIKILVENAPTVNEWISVKERLPEEGGEYLVVLGLLNDKWGPSVDLRWFAKDMRKCFSVSEKFKRRPGWYFHDGEWGDVEDTTVTHWMKKPEPPEVEE